MPDYPERGEFPPGKGRDEAATLKRLMEGWKGWGLQPRSEEKAREMARIEQEYLKLTGANQGWEKELGKMPPQKYLSEMMGNPYAAEEPLADEGPSYIERIRDYLRELLGIPAEKKMVNPNEEQQNPDN